MRLDFETFVIAGPSTVTASSVMTLNGELAAGGVASNLVGQCLIDRFTVSNPSGLSPPVVCGTLPNEHSE